MSLEGEIKLLQNNMKDLQGQLANAHKRISELIASRDTAFEDMKKETFKINKILKDVFSKAGMILIDYKLEFGSFNGGLLLGDEFTPDGCRVWDAKTREKLDKDRFTQVLGGVVESYEIIASKLGIQ